jgi:HxlR-like helix-turn-helix protein
MLRLKPPLHVRAAACRSRHDDPDRFRRPPVGGDGIIVRTVYPQVPPKVEYPVTPFGKTLEPLLKQLVIWAEPEIRPLLSTSGSKMASASGRPAA